MRHYTTGNFIIAKLLPKNNHFSMVTLIFSSLQRTFGTVRRVSLCGLWEETEALMEISAMNTVLYKGNKGNP